MCIRDSIFPAHPAGQQNAQGNGRINMTARDSSDIVCHRHNGQAESKSYSQRSDTCTNRPAALPAKTALPHPIRTRTVSYTHLGSQCFFTSDESQLTWLPDQPYAAGSWGYIGGKEGTAQTEIQNTADDPLFQTLRHEIEGYRFDAPQGVYEIELLFTDIFRRNAGIAYQLDRNGQQENRENTFGISINGEVMERCV